MEINIHKKLGNFELNIDYKTNFKRIGIFGASGTGKSMTLKCIAGVEKADSGRIADETTVYYDSEKKINLKPQERKIGYLFQNYALFPTMTVEQNISSGLTCKKDEKQQIANELMERFKIKDKAKLLPHELSGGEQQRTAFARMMAGKPKMILLDEPFSSLDDFLREHMEEELEKMLKDFDGTVMLVSHSKKEIERFCEEVIRL